MLPYVHNAGDAYLWKQTIKNFQHPKNNIEDDIDYIGELETAWRQENEFYMKADFVGWKNCLEGFAIALGEKIRLENPILSSDSDLMGAYQICVDRILQKAGLPLTNEAVFNYDDLRNEINNEYIISLVEAFGDCYDIKSRCLDKDQCINFFELFKSSTETQA